MSDPRILRIANALGMNVKWGRTSFGLWDGRRAIWSTSMPDYARVHEVSHFIIAPKTRRRLFNYGLGDGRKRPPYVSTMLGFWEEALANNLDRGILAYLNQDPYPQFNTWDEDAREYLETLGLLTQRRGWPKWSTVFARCGKEFRPCLLR